MAQHSASVTLSAIVDPAPAAIALAARCGVPHYKSVEDLLTGERPDGVVLGTPNPLHVKQALQCMGTGLPAR